ncbi:hypothetical protein [Paenibacillus glacialis]|uniref:Uncharacterized protein n=1 Tax=Paenibacillus glacialis TaxID=494026 RepID=A0A162KCF6_9BACL|nr:hypothetical protein [Paenibacillus glacialis]OAB43718.1 hypothetical protein PGLA_08015 [Paenibacillus glacialis]
MSTRTIIIFILLVGVVFFILQYNGSGLTKNSNLNIKISTEQISSTQMSKVVYSHETIPNIKFIEVELTEEQIRNIADWINTVPTSSIKELNHIPSNISAGIVFRLKSKKEIRIQYDLEGIFITRTDIKSTQVMYSIYQDNLKHFFDEQLKGFYFEQDRLNNS